jgi:uncharacterized protein (DUF488 family)
MNVYTLGHSNHSIERFIELLSMHYIGAVADVRSSPWSRFAPQFNRELLQMALRQADISYVFLGAELGARPQDASYYIDGKVNFARIAVGGPFNMGLERVRRGSEKMRIALMCAEKDPIGCHRTILVCRHLRAPGVTIEHILEDGSLENNNDTERRLMELFGIPENDLFASREEQIEKAYDYQAQKIAYAPKDEQ